MAQNLTAHNFDWLTFTGQSLSGSGDRAPLSCIILMMVTMLGEVLVQRLANEQGIYMPFSFEWEFIMGNR